MTDSGKVYPACEYLHRKNEQGKCRIAWDEADDMIKEAVCLKRNAKYITFQKNSGDTGFIPVSVFC